ncbi:MAG: hypothetical protein HY505_01495 [Candidatus Yanofskybacteria bacterium]|nr:hypothetical protein [Candidatus Yanofskybacteria bacterium]
MKEKPKQNKESARDIESRHFGAGPSDEIDPEIFRANRDSLDMAKQLLFMKEAELVLDTDSENISMALVKNKKGEIIFATDLPSEIEELSEIEHDMPH